MSELKERALLERIGELTVDYENKVADLRVAVTHLSTERDQLRKEISEHQPDTNEYVPYPPEGVLEGTVVQ